MTTSLPKHYMSDRESCFCVVFWIIRRLWFYIMMYSQLLFRYNWNKPGCIQIELEWNKTLSRIRSPSRSRRLIFNLKNKVDNTKCIMGRLIRLLWRLMKPEKRQTRKPVLLCCGCPLTGLFFGPGVCRSRRRRCCLGVMEDWSCFSVHRIFRYL